ncbi:PREDICTED: uncharacterized protein LOC109209422 [Nicotiana attenuata]|uniref:uncharacterized protein LOC109209422 n=1 Tax=Nicotiana attenuata TaxID=49451 RepID=UPI0009048671|nr:PREDICTED: uncharacterized protein LOC109209422 [Nicotiana attenuata]
MAKIDNEVPEKLSHNHPLFLNSNDNSGAILISLQLRGPENYSVWSRAMRIAILGRNKLGFIDGTSPVSGCDCEKSREFVVFMERLKLLQFLMGLNEFYEQARKNPDNNALRSTRGGFHQKSKKNFNHICDYCNYKGHTKENCLKLNGYPADFKHKKKGSSFPTANFAGNNSGSGTNFAGNNSSGSLMHTIGSQDLFSIANFAGNNSGGNQGESSQTQLAAPPLSAPYFTPEQYQLILEMLGKVNEETTGSAQPVTAGTSSIFRDQDLQNVLHIPDFKFSLLSMSKLTKELKCCVAFFPIFASSVGRYTWIFLVNNKTEIFVVVKQFLALVKIMFNTNVQILRTDNGCEFFNSLFDELIKENGIVHQSSCVYIPQQNGVVERKHRSILNVARSLRFQGDKPLKFWRECVATDVYLLNRLRSAILQHKSFFEMLHSHPPNLGHLRTFGCLAYASNPNITDKMSPRATSVALVGYSSTQKGYKLYDLHAKSFFVSRNVVFREDLFPFKHFTPSTLPMCPVLELALDTPRTLPNTTPSNITISPPTSEDSVTESPSSSIPSTVVDHFTCPAPPNNTITECTYHQFTTYHRETTA